MKEITIIGAGSVGVNTALFLDRLGFNVTLIEDAADILEGASQATFVTHADGLEYYKPDQYKTGIYCIDGIITKQLLYPAQSFKTKVCHQGNPVHFLVSAMSSERDGLNMVSFSANAERMRQHFTSRYNDLVTKFGEEHTKRLLERNPETFAQELQADEYADCAYIAGGYAGTSNGINMPHYFAFLKTALNKSRVNLLTSQKTQTITSSDDGYQVITNDNDVYSDYIIITAGHHLPSLCKKIPGVKLSLKGTFYLNGMTVVKLPATTDQEKIKQVTRINFTLQGEGGCMFACILPPTSEHEGLGAVYFPSESGSQFEKHTDSGTMPPPSWEQYIKNGVSNNNEKIKAVIHQAYRIYPFLENYAELDRTIFRTVFNPSTPGDETGEDRRVREIVPGRPLTVDGKIVAYSGPKWTNVELVALMAVNDVLNKFDMETWPIDTQYGLGHAHLDVEQISRKSLNFKDLKAEISFAYHYCDRYNWPQRLVDPTCGIFS